MTEDLILEAQCLGALGRTPDANDAIRRCGTLLDKDDDARTGLAWEIKQKYGLTAPMAERAMPFQLRSEHDVLFELTARALSPVSLLASHPSKLPSRRAYPAWLT